MKLKLNNSEADFNFEVSAAELKAAIQKVETVTNFGASNDSEKAFLLACYHKNIYIVGYSTETMSVIQLEAKNVSKESSSFGFTPSVLLGLINSRDALRLEYSGSTLNIKALKGKYNCRVQTFGVVDDQLPRVNKVISQQVGNKSVSSKVLSSLKDGLKQAELKEMYVDSKSNLACYITLENSRLTIDSFDNFHLASYKTKIKTKESFKLAIYESTFSLLSRFIQDTEESELYISSKGIRLVSNSFIVALPPIQVEDDQFSIVQSYIKALGKADIQFTLSKQSIATVNNMLVLAGKDSKFEFQLNPKGLVRLSLSVDGGSVEDTFKCSSIDLGKHKKGIKFKVDPNLFSDLFRKFENENEFTIDLFVSKDSEDNASCFMSHRKTKDANLALIGTFYA